MDYLYKLRSAVSTVKSTVESALPGNPIGREYEATTVVASGGLSLCWTIYDGYKKSNKQEVSIWWLEKKHMEKWPPRDRDVFLDIIKRGVQQLTRLRHPRLLVVEHALEESKDSLAFCTEPVLASLANILNPQSLSNSANGDGATVVSPTAEENVLKNFKLHDVEIKHGFKELVEAMRFLHFDARMIHRNLRPESIIITKRNSWKLSGFEFCLASITPADQSPSYPPVDYDSQCPSFGRPQLDYCAPELVLGGRVDVQSDIYSFGVVFFSVFNNGKRLFEYHDDVAAFRRNVENMKTLPPGKLGQIPDIVRDDLKLCLQFTPELRPDAAQLLLIKYLEDPCVKTLTTLESLRLMDGMEKANFFKALPSAFSTFPERVLTRRVLPALADEMKVHAQSVPMVLPSVLQAAELLGPKEFAKFALPALEPVFFMDKAYQAWHLLLQKLDLLLSKLSSEDVRRLVVPMACSALDSESAALQEGCAQSLHKIVSCVDPETMRKRIVPRLLMLATEINVLSVRVNALLCIGRILDKLEKWQVTEQILPALAKVQSRDPAVLMAVLGVFRLSFSNTKLGGLGREVCAKVCLPFLVTSCVENALNGRQFEAFMSLIRDMLNKVETEQRRRLEQTPGAVVEDGLASSQSFDSKDAREKSPALVPITTASASIEKKGGTLTMEEKRRLANEQEKNIQFRSATALEPVLTPVTAATTPTLTAITPISKMVSPPNFAPSPASFSLGPAKASSSTASSTADPFASLNAFSMTQNTQSKPQMLSSPPGQQFAYTQQQQRPQFQQQWTSSAMSMSPRQPGMAAGIIPPPPTAPVGSAVRTPQNVWTPPPAANGGIQNVMRPNLFSQQQGQTQPSKTTSVNKAQDDLADLLG